MTPHPCFFRSELQPSQANKREPTASLVQPNVGFDFHNPLSESGTLAFNRCPFPSHLAVVIEITHYGKPITGLFHPA